MEEVRASMLNKILGGKVRDKYGKYRNEGKYWKKRCRREGKYMEGKGIEIRGSTLKEGPRAGMVNRLLGREVRDKTGVREIEESAKGKGSTEGKGSKGM